MTSTQSELRTLLYQLREEHRDLDTAIRSLQEGSAVNAIEVQRLKKRKLALKDRIEVLETKLTPDIIA